MTMKGLIFIFMIILAIATTNAENPSCEKLDKQLQKAKEKLKIAQQKLKSFRSNKIKKQLCNSYEIWVTEDDGTFDRMRAECERGGSDLAGKEIFGFGPEGKNYFRKITTLVKPVKSTWVGLHDRISADSGSGSSNGGGGGYGGGNAAGLLSNDNPTIGVLSSSGNPKYIAAAKTRHTPVGVIIEDGVVRYDMAYTPAFISKARMLCAERGGEIVSRALSTLQKRKEFIRKLVGPGDPDSAIVQYMWIGIQRRGGRWYYEDNTPVHLSTFGKIQQYQAGQDCANIRLSSGKVFTHWCYNKGLGVQNFLICYYPLRIKFRLPGKQTAFKNQLNFQQARKFCHQKGGRIALSSIKTHEKLRELVKSGKVADGEYWIGVQKVGQSAWTYQYIDEATVVEPATFPWLPNYPTFVRYGEQCAVLSVNKSTIGVKNQACGSHRPVLCEFSS